MKKEFQEVRARVEGTIADINQGVAQTEYEASQAHQLLSNSFDVLRRKSHDSEQLAQSLAHANQLLAVAQTSLRAKPVRRLSSPDTLPKSRKLNF